VTKLYDVAVIGFGPSGSVAAGLLGGAGVSTFVCDRLRGVYDKPRAMALDHEIMRVFQELGVVDQIEPWIAPFRTSEFRGIGGRLIKRIDMVPPPYPLGYVPTLVFTQPPVEAVLREHATALPTVEVALGTELLALEPRADQVVLSLQDEDGAPRTVNARYVIACDGAASTVRRQLAIELEDLGFDEPWLVVDLLVNEHGLAKLPDVSIQFCEPDRPCTMVIGPRNHRRWEISLLPGENLAAVVEPTETWRLLSRWLTPDDAELWRQASYRFHALVARTWRHGRVFIAGDAAHQQPPFIGQGMCQGIRDVANLSWKLRAVLDGRAGDRLLDSYGVERGQHVRQLTSRLKVLGRVICERDAAAAQRRDDALLAETGGTVRTTTRQDIVPPLETGLLSPDPSTARGTLFPQPWIRQGQGTVRLDALAGTGWRLMTDGSSAADSDLPGGVVGRLDLRVVRVAPPPSAEADVLVETEGVLSAWFRRHGCTAALVRPDHYVFGVARTHAEFGRQLAQADQMIR
jgi:3-(3-hydroxy-phenyl)propionate hydroxylase